MSPSSITNSWFMATIQQAMVDPIQVISPFKIPIQFSNVMCLKVVSDSYTPNNDYRYVFQSITQTESPNFLMFICDGPVNITFGNDRGFIASQIHVNRIYVHTMPQSSDDYIKYLYLEGRIGNGFVDPMAQNVPVNYTIVYGQAQIS